MKTYAEGQIVSEYRGNSTLVISKPNDQKYAFFFHPINSEESRELTGINHVKDNKRVYVGVSEKALEFVSRNESRLYSRRDDATMTLRGIDNELVDPCFVRMQHDYPETITLTVDHGSRGYTVNQSYKEE